MPPRRPRSLFFQTEYFQDHEFQTELNADQREAYLGIAQLADDEGWLDWVPQQVAYYLFVFREEPLKVLDSVVDALKRTQRLRIYACGHAQLLRWGLKRRHVGRHLSPDNSVADAHRSHAKRSGKLPATKQNTGGDPAETSRIRGASSTSIRTSNSTNAHAGARARGGAPRSMKEALKDYGFEPNGSSAKSSQPLPSGEGFRHD